MSFTTPLALLLLLAIPYLVWLGRPRPNAPRKWREWSSLTLRTLIMICLVLALAGFQIVRTADTLAVVFLVDASDSISIEQAQQAEQFVRGALETMDETRDEAAVIVFGANALVERPMSALDELAAFNSIPQTLHTDLAEAIRLGLAIFPAGSARRMVILSDGAATIGDTDEAARLAAANGVQIDYVPLLRSAAETEAWLTNVSAPTKVSQGEVFNIDITAESTADMGATLRVLAGGQIVSEEAVQLRVGANNFRVRLQAAEQDFTRYSVQLTPAQDSYFQNNQLAAFTEITGPPRVLLVASDGTVDDLGNPLPDESPQLFEALQATGIEVDRIIPADLPSNFAELSDYASIILVDVNAKRLTPRKMEALQTYVRDLGGGLVVVGGPESYGMGGYFRTPLEETLPVNMQINDEERFPSVSIAIVIDRSGSMSATEGGLTKIQLAAEGAVRVVELLNDFDEISVIPVDTAPSGQVGPISASQRAQAIDLIRGIGAGGGGIYVRTGLEAAAEALAQSSTQVKHIILLADGADSEQKDGVPELIDSLTASDVTISVVAIGNGSDVQWLQEMAERGNGRFHFTDRAANLPQIFTQETTSIQRSYLIEERFFPELASTSPILSGIRQVPALFGYVGSSEKDTAQVILQSHLGDPLLASWQYGLGRSVAWTSDATGRWATNWVQWEGFPVFWAQTVRWTITQGRNSSVETLVTFDDETALLTVDARTPDGTYINNLPMEASVVSPSGVSQNLELQQVAPGRYEAVFTPDEQGAYFIRVAGGDDSTETVIGQTSGWVLGYSPEYRQFEANPQLLDSLASLTDGRNLGEVAESAFAHTLPVESTARPIAPFLLLLATILLPFDIGVRRLVVTRRDLQRAWAATFGRVFPGRAVPVEHERAGQMSSLFEAKQRATANRGRDEGGSEPAPIQREDASKTTPPTAKPSTPTPPPSAVSKPPASKPPASGSLASRLLEKKRQQNQGDEE
ncbi:MAG: VWA domain-containing protein [Anaerolineales bacterium]|nr:VWA domain-containing protein [Anaerolineales bacterium]